MAIVEGLFAPSKDSLVSAPIKVATVRFGGILEDTRHFGITKRSGAREKQYLRGTEIFNYRQVSLVEVNELQEIALALGIDSVSAEALGANLLVSGIENFTKLPPTTRLFFEGGATIVIFGENDPCILPGRVLEAFYKHPKLASKFVRAAIGRRGVIGWVEREGEIKIGETVKAVYPNFSK